MRATGASSKPTNSGACSAADDAAALAARAAAAARAELRGERENILGAVGLVAPAPLRRVRSVPERWTLPHVMDRLEEAFRVLSRLPLPTRPKGYINSMPRYLYDQGDLNSQAETYEFERMAKIRNRVRLPPSPAEVERSDENLKLQASRHADNATALRELAAKLDQHAAAVAMIRPTVASLELSRSKLATWASVGIGAVMVLGWIVEAGAKWCLSWALSHFQ
jgi:hypothetical protein